MKRLTKTCLTALLCSAALTSAATAQGLGPINESSIDLSDFAQAPNLPTNPLPGEPSTILDGPRPTLSGGGSSTRSIATSPTVAKPPTSIDGATAPAPADATSVVDTGEVIYEDGYYEGDVYEGVVEGQIQQVHTVFGLSALGFRRNYGEDRLLSNNFTERGDTLTSGDADHRQIGGFETYLNCRSSDGVGWEFRYFGLDPSDNTATLGNSPTTVLVGLNDVAVAPGEQTVSDIFADGNFHTVTRESSIYNFEFNFLRNRPNVGWFNGMFRNTETLIGFRYIDFDEALRYETASDSGISPRTVAFDQSVENSLYGLQTGARTEFNLIRRLSGSLGLKLGVFYNDAQANRNISGSFADGSDFNPSIQNGTTGISGYNFNASDDEGSFLAELDLGLIYQLNQASRLRFGYRRIGISNLAFASNNIPDDLANVQQIQDIDTNQNLRLRGIYFAYELAF